ncbi:hypothetical protein A7982_12096 [Minicystis rosea]|nr:hypothetical protein A7982_12096 [Minicystis rosea]
MERGEVHRSRSELRASRACSCNPFRGSARSRQELSAHPRATHPGPAGADGTLDSRCQAARWRPKAFHARPCSARRHHLRHDAITPARIVSEARTDSAQGPR